MRVATGQSDGTVELRPSAQEYRGAVLARAVAMLPVIVFTLARVVRGGDSLLQRLVIPLGLLILVGVLVALSIIHLRSSVVRLSPGRVDHHALLVPDRSLSIEGVKGVLTSMGQPLTPSLVVLVLRSPGSGTTLRLTGGVWTFDALQTIARHAGVGVSDRQMSGMDIERLVPSSMPLRYRRPWTFGIGLALFLIAVVTAAIVVWPA